MSEENQTKPSVIPVRVLMEAGVHFGHQTKRWNPKMKPYLYGSRDGIHIINLSQTQRLFRDAYNFISKVVSRGGHVLFLGTKQQARGILAEEAARAGQYYVVNRWLGGMLTNWQTIRLSIERLQNIERMKEEGSLMRLPKKEQMRTEKLRLKLEANLGGIKTMAELPSAIFVVDPRREHIGVTEARRLNIPVVGVTDSNCDPDELEYVIPGNDDAIRAIRLFSSRIADACLEGAAGRRERSAFTPASVGVGDGAADVKVVVRKKPAELIATAAAAAAATAAAAVAATTAPAEATAAEAPAAEATAAEATAEAAPIEGAVTPDEETEPQPTPS